MNKTITLCTAAATSLLRSLSELLPMQEFYTPLQVGKRHAASFLLVFTFLFSFVGEGWGQSFATIGSGTTQTTSTGNDPIDGYYASFRYQVVYTAAELLAAGMSPNATISGLGFSISGDYGGGNLLGYTIKMAHTTAVNSASHNTTTLTTVRSPFSYNPSVVAAGSFDMITFSSNFMWDGVSNVLIDICSDGPNAYTSPYGQVRTIASSTTSGSRHVRSDFGAQCGVSTGTTNSTKPQIRFAWSGSSPCSGTPAPGNTISSSAAVAPGSTVNLSLQTATVGTGVTYQWESSTTSSSTGFSSIAGATSSTYTATVNAATWYRCVVTCAGNSGTSNATQVTLTYCTPVPSSVDGSGIINVSFGIGPAVNNSTATESGNYGNYSAQIGAAYQGTNLPVNITLGTGYTYGTQIWVDWNNDLDFLDAGELVYTGLSGSANPTTLAASFNIPLATLAGNYRMRIGATDNDSGPGTPCYTGSWGSFEDYTLSVLTLPGCSGTPNAGTAAISSTSGCSGNSITLSATGLTTGLGMTYQWQTATSSSGPWTDISGATSSSYAFTSTTGQTFYKLVSTCSGVSSSSNVVSFTGVSCGSTNVPASGNNSVACGTSTYLYDNGGASGSYSSSNDGYTVLNNSGSGVINLSGNFTYIETNWDYLRIYAGVGTTGTLLATYSNSSGGTIAPYSSSPGQSLTVQFTSDGSGEGAGFAMQVIYSGSCVGCSSLNAPLDAATNVSQVPTLSWNSVPIATGYDVYLSTNQAQVNSLNGAALVSLNQPGTTYTPTLNALTTYYWAVIPRNNSQTAVNCSVWSFTTQAPVPTVAATSLTSFGNVCVGSVSSSVSFNLSGTNLVGDVIISAPTGFSISSTSNGVYGSSLTISSSAGSLASTPIYVKFAPTLVQAYAGDISIESSGATTVSVALSGTGMAVPTVNAGTDVTICSGSSTTLSGATSATSLTQTGTASSGSVTTSGLDNSTPTATYTFSGLPSGATVTGITVNVTSAGGAYCPSWYSVTTWINNAQQGVAGCTGSTSYTNFNGQAANGLVIAVKGQDNDAYGDNMSIAYNVTLNYSYTVSPTYAWSPTTALSSTNTLTTTSNPTSQTTYTLTVTATNGCSASDAIVVSVDQCPALSSTAASSFSNTCTGATSSTQTLTVAGLNLQNDVLLTAPTGFGLSTSSTGPFTTSLTLTPATGTLAGTSVFVAFAPTAAISYSGNISIESAGATSLSIPVSGTGIPSPTVSAGPDVTICYSTSTTLTGSTNATSTPATGSFNSGTVSGSGLDNTNPVVSYTFSGLPSGATVTGMTVNITSAGGGFCPSWYSVTTLINNVQQGVASCSGSTTYTNFNGQAANGLVVAVKGQDNDAWGDNMSISFNVTLTYSYDISPTYAWSPSAGLSSISTLSTTANPLTTTNYTLTITGTNGCVSTDQVSVIIDNCPALNSTAASAFANTCAGSNSASQSISVAGFNLQGNAQVTAPAGFGLSTSASGPFTSSVSLSPVAGTLSATNVFIVLSPTAATSYSGDILIQSTGATSVAVPVSGLGIFTPTIAAGPDVSICTGASTALTGTSDATSSTGTGSISSGNVTGSGLDNTNPTASYTFSGLPAGATVTGITVNVTSAGGGFCPSWYSVSTWINNAQQGAAGCAGTSTYTNFNGQAANGLVVSVKGQDNDAWGDNMSIAYNVTLTYSYPIAPTYAWTPSTGLSSTSTLSSTANPTTTTNYTLTVTGTNGCTASDNVIVTVMPLPATPVVSTPGTYCGNTVLTANNGGSGIMYFQGTTSNGTSITTPSTSESITTSGTYYFRAREGVCWGTETAAAVVINPIPNPGLIAGGNNGVCVGSSITLSNNISGGVWTSSNPNLATIDAQTGVVNAISAGSVVITYTVTNSFGCVNASTKVLQIKALPSNQILIPPATQICAGESVSLQASTAQSYLWSNNVTTQTLSVTTSGTYSVIITGANGCSSNSNAVTITVIPAPTIASISGVSGLCMGAAQQYLNATPNGLWSSSNSAVLAVNPLTGLATPVSPGSATLTYHVANMPGCLNANPGTASQVIAVNALPNAQVTQNGSTTFCQGDSITLVASAGASYLWSSGQTTQSIVVNAAGTYQVAITTANGCSANSNSVQINVNPVPNATIYPGNNIAICAGASINITTGSAVAYTWSNGQTTPSINVSSAGTFTVALTGSNGCTVTSDPIVVSVIQVPVAAISANGSTTICPGSSVTLTASPATSYLWSTGETTQSIDVSAAGSYSVNVGSGSCSASSTPVFVAYHPTPQAQITASGPTAFCQGAAVTLQANTGAGLSYLWSTGATTSSISTQSAGTYSVQVTNGFGCTSAAASIQTVVNPLPTMSQISGPSSVCSNGQIQLSIPMSGGVYSSSNLNTATVGHINGLVTGLAAGSSTISYTYTNLNGCTATVEYPITILAAPIPTISTSGSTAFCQGGSVELSAPTASSYLWSTGATTQSIVVNTAGNYGLTMTAANGCSASAQQVGVQVLAQPSIAAISGSSSVCVNASTQLSNATTNGLWSSSDVSKATVNPMSGLVTGLAVGSVAISYQVTASNGCAASTSLSMTVQSPTPTSISASGSTTLCPGASVTLTASPGTSYLWSTGATTQSITVAQAGTYQVSSMNNGCYSNSTATSVSVQPAISTALTTSGATTFCAGNNVTITAPSAGAYLWSTGATTQSIVANATGNYSVVLTTNGCSATSAPLAVVVNALPTPTIAASGATTLCAGATVVLTSSPASSYLWSNGANTQSITVNAAGSYGLSVTANGCSASATPTVVTMAPSPNSVITNTGSTTFCAGSSVVLNGPTPPSGTTFGYVWRLNGTPISGASAPTYTASTAGNYSLVLTNNQGCTSTSTNTSVTVNALPTATITPAASTTICAGAAVTLTASAGSAYLWSNGATTQSISASTAGAYTVTVNSNGCSATSAPITVSVTALPNPTVAANGPTTICQGSNVVLTASPAATYLWSNGATTASITVNTAGNYSVLSTQNGCSATSAVTTINVTPLPTPTISTIGTTTFCQGGSVTLTAATASSYLWNNGATTQSIVVSSAGSYSVNVSNNGCAATSAPVVVVVQVPPSASVTANGPLNFCQGASVTLTATPATAYSWSNGATTQSIVVNTAGNYSVQVTNANGCVATSVATTISVQAPPAVPQIQVVGSLSLCPGASVTLTAPIAASYLWSNGATTQSITLSTATSMGLSVSNAAGCSASAVPVVVSTLTAPPATITASGSTSICAGSNVVLTAAPASSYLWSTGATTQSISVQTAGSYTVQSTLNGCSATSVPTLVEVYALPVSTVVASGPTTFCQGGSVTLSAEPATSYLWSNGATTQSITVQVPGAYTVNLSSNGCSALSTPIQVAVQALPSTNISTSGALTFCEGASVTLTADPAASYAWSNGATSQSISLATTQTVGLTVSNGVCSASATPISVQMLAAPALGSNTGAAAVCLGASAQLSNAVANGVWSSQNPGVVGIDPITGVYTGLGAGTANLTYTVTYANGCVVSSTSPVVVNTISPVSIAANGPLSFCSGGAVQLSLPAGFAYQWSTNQTGSQIIVNTTGAYGATVTNAAGCSYQVSPVQVTVNTAPAIAIQASAPAICSGQSVNLTSSINAASYSWSTGSQSNSITVQQPATYVLTVVDANGCSASTLYTLGTGITPNATIAAAGPTNFCAGANVVLNANSYVGGSYLWSNGATTPSITASNSGAYTVTVTSPSGCSATSNPISVNVLSAPVATINLTGSATSCSNQFVSLAVSGTGTYLWTNNATSQSIVPTTTGNYGVTVTGSNGCTTTIAPVSVTILPAPTAQIAANGPTTFCQGGSVDLTASGASIYGWSNGQSGSTLSASTAGTYVLTATAANGCSDTASIDVTVNALPANFIVASGPLSFCEGGSVILSAASGNTYLWSNGAFTSSIDVTTSGSYSATVTSPEGCVVSTNAIAVQVNQPTTSTINATGVADYILNDIMYTQSGAYTQTLTNAAGCDSTITLNLTLTVGLDEKALISFSVQPNPTDAVFTLKASEALFSNYVIQDAQGKVVATGALNGTSTTIDIDQVARGIYFLKVAEAAEAIRIVKN